MKGRNKLKPERIVIGEGIALNVLPCTKFKTNCIALRLVAPLTKESASLNALLPFVLKRGCTSYPTVAEMERHLEELYGSDIHAGVGKTGNSQYFGFTSYPLSDTYAEGVRVSDEILSLMAELIFSPVLKNGLLDPETVQREKDVLTDRIKATINNKNKYAVKRCAEEMGKGDPSSVSETGTVEDVEAITPEALTNALKDAVRRCRIEIWCAGDFDIAGLERTCRRLFDIKNRDPYPVTEVNRIADAKSLKRVTEEQPVKQGKLCVGFTTSVRPQDGDAPVLNLFLEIFSNSPISKLFLNVRERLSLCYYCSAIANKPKGTVTVASGIEVDKANIAEEAIIKELNDCVNGLITEEEMTSAKKAMISSSKSIYDDYGSLISWYFSQLDRDVKMTPEEYTEKAVAATVGDVSRVASTLKLHTVYFLKGTLKEENDG